MQRSVRLYIAALSVSLHACPYTSSRYNLNALSMSSSISYSNSIHILVHQLFSHVKGFLWVVSVHLEIDIKHISVACLFHKIQLCSWIYCREVQEARNYTKLSISANSQAFVLTIENLRIFRKRVICACMNDQVIRKRALKSNNSSNLHLLILTQFWVCLLSYCLTHWRFAEISW